MGLILAMALTLELTMVEAGDELVEDIVGERGALWMKSIGTAVSDIVALQLSEVPPGEGGGMVAVRLAQVHTCVAVASPWSGLHKITSTFGDNELYRLRSFEYVHAFCVKVVVQPEGDMNIIFLVLCSIATTLQTTTSPT